LQYGTNIVPLTDGWFIASIIFDYWSAKIDKIFQFYPILSTIFYDSKGYTITYTEHFGYISARYEPTLLDISELLHR
jgi:hypothetical protein